MSENLTELQAVSDAADQRYLGLTGSLSRLSMGISSTAAGAIMLLNRGLEISASHETVNGVAVVTFLGGMALALHASSTVFEDRNEYARAEAAIDNHLGID